MHGRWVGISHGLHMEVREQFGGSHLPPFLFAFQDRVLLCSPSWLGTHYIGQAGLQLSVICLPLPPECCDGDMSHPVRL